MPDPIEHVVVLMFENNSFDRMLGCMQAVYPGLAGVDPNKTRINPDYPDTTRVFLQSGDAAFSIPDDPAHDLDDVLQQIDEGGTGFVTDFVQHYPQASDSERGQIMSYFALGTLPVLHTLARNFLVCDHWFASVPGPTWPNRFFVHSGTSLGHVDMPSGFLHPAIHCYNQPTVFQRLSERGVSWKIYYGDVPQSLLMLEQLKYPTRYHQLDSFAADAAGAAQGFPQYTFLEPNYFGVRQCDQHPPSDVRHGEALLAQVYNALRGNQDLWNSTLLVVLYDEHGGFYDHVSPPEAVAPDANTQSFAFNRLGPRVPAILISPWLDAGVLATEFDHTSLLQYATRKWGLGPLGARVTAAQSFGDSWTLRQTPRADCPRALAAQPADANAVDPALNAHQTALAGFTHHLETNLMQTDDATVARHSRQMTGAYAQQSQTVAERVENFLRRGL
jgi:phospholipase C